MFHCVCWLHLYSIRNWHTAALQSTKCATLSQVHDIIHRVFDYLVQWYYKYSRTKTEAGACWTSAVSSLITGWSYTYWSTVNPDLQRIKIRREIFYDFCSIAKCSIFKIQRMGKIPGHVVSCNDVQNCQMLSCNKRIFDDSDPELNCFISP